MSDNGSNGKTGKKTFIIFSGEMDKVLAGFVLANSAAAMGDEVTMFFTFWGLNVLRKEHAPHANGKTALQRMFGAMRPHGPSHLALSHMNFAGVGPKLMSKAMHDQHVDSIEGMIETAREQGVKFVACTMSMDVMGIKPEELIDDIEYAGAASYLAEADEANLNLFI